ncbi:MAG: prepilin peptidase [Pseudomonadota bacterium]
MTPELFLFALVIVAAATDLAARRIPNLLPLSGLALALACQLSGAGGGSALSWLAGALAGLCLFLPFYALHGMAAGDVKLMAAVGAFVGPLLALKIGLVTFVVGGAMACAILLATGRVGACLRNLGILLRACDWRARRAAGAPVVIVSVGGIPYAVAIALSTIGVLMWERA